MWLKKLFEVQQVLRERIGYDEPDRFDKLVLALLVELGECANEWRGFKFWSKDQEPRKLRIIQCSKCNGTGTPISLPESSGIDCESCEGAGELYVNPLLEEYVDGLHFVLELGLEFGFQKVKPFLVHTDLSFEKMFLKLNKIIAQLVITGGREHKQYYFGELLSNFLGLGKMLGFTWEQIEQAYMDKNKVNHERQEQGY